MTKTFDVIIVGGGAAGLSGALALARSRRRVLVIDAGNPRNASAKQIHNYLGREGTPPAELLAIARAEVQAYGVVIQNAIASAATRDEDETFVVTSGETSFRGRRLLVTTGLVDELPPVTGLVEGWGTSVVHCPFCHGWEVRDQAIGVLATGPMALHQALMFRQLSADITVFTHTSAPLTAEQAEQLAALDIAVVHGEVAAWEKGGVRLMSGDLIPRRVLVTSTRLRARADVLASLGLETSELDVGGQSLGTYIASDSTGRTTMPGVWVAGNITDPMAQVISSAAAGLAAGAAINGDLVAEDARRAVDRHRARTGE